MLEKEWDETEDAPPKKVIEDNLTVEDLAYEHLRAEERIQTIIMRENNQ